MCTFTRNAVCGKQNEVRQNGKADVAIFLCCSTYMKDQWHTDLAFILIMKTSQNITCR